MAVVSLKNSWVNADGLAVPVPRDAGTVTRGGERDFDGRHETFVEIDLTALPTVASADTQLVAEYITIPNGALVEDVEIVVTKAATSAGSATLDIGLVDQDRSTEIDFNGLVAALAKTAIDAIGEHTKINVGSTGAGALVGTKITNTGLLVAQAGTADFTAGKIEVRIHWFVPNSADL